MAEEETMEISDALEKVAKFAFEEARQKLEEAGEFTPFTVMLEGENLFVETHPGDDADECYGSAQNTILAASAAVENYVFCYDGYVDLDDGEHDAIIVEAAEKGDDVAYALALTYELEEDAYTFEELPAYIGDAPSFFDPDAFPSDVEDIASEEGSCGCGCGCSEEK